MSRLPDSEVGLEVVEMSGSKRKREYSLREVSHNGVRFARCGFRTSTRYFCSLLAICSSAQAEKTDILTMTSAFELRPFKSPIEADSDSVAKLSKADTRSLR